MAVLTQFLLRLSFGLAFGMAITSPRSVSSGFFRNHLYVTLGLTTLAALVAAGTGPGWVMWLAIVAAGASYVGSVAWLYEAGRFGRLVVGLVAAASLLAAWAGLAAGHGLLRPGAPTGAHAGRLELASLLPYWAAVSSGLVLGLTTAAMLLGHWYLNAPGMQLAPLRRLLAAAAAAVGLQAVLSAAGLAGILAAGEGLSLSVWLFVALRWSFGLVGVLALLWMAWQTLRVPNTQSATGILYVAVIGVFVGELAALLLSAESAYPL